MGSRPDDLRHLADFDVSRRVLLIAAFALPIGVLSACVSWVLMPASSARIVHVRPGSAESAAPRGVPRRRG